MHDRNSVAKRKNRHRKSVSEKSAIAYPDRFWFCIIDDVVDGFFNSVVEASIVVKNISIGFGESVENPIKNIIITLSPPLL